MEIFILTFLIIVLSISGLAIGSLFGRPEIKSTCSRIAKTHDDERCGTCDCGNNNSVNKG